MASIDYDSMMFTVNDRDKFKIIDRFVYDNNELSFSKYSLILKTKYSNLYDISNPYNYDKIKNDSTISEFQHYSEPFELCSKLKINDLEVYYYPYSKKPFGNDMSIAYFIIDKKIVCVGISGTGHFGNPWLHMINRGLPKKFESNIYKMAYKDLVDYYYIDKINKIYPIKMNL